MSEAVLIGIMILVLIGAQNFCIRDLQKRVKKLEQPRMDPPKPPEDAL